jgi:hypothetical protein
MEAFEFIFYIFIFIGVWFLIITLNLLLQKGWKKRKGRIGRLRRIWYRFHNKDNASETPYLIKHREHQLKTFSTKGPVDGP